MILKTHSENLEAKAKGILNRDEYLEFIKNRAGHN